VATGHDREGARVEDQDFRGQTLDLGGPESLSFLAVASGLIAASGKPGRIQHIPLPVLRVLSVLARPFSPGFARKAGAAVVMNTTDMSFEDTARKRVPSLPKTTLDTILLLGDREPAGG
jgi:uncharacterized protein YbjT (DUF2867 family)